ncbi:MAG: 1-aminocyclopropane-1-carboxylate deaminase [Arcobacter sp.]|uniref:1-aminocyclopropane-1-carboxylate deaminase/D-cysteine desulfhydrase n=1 Tax=uncultured Arcobacter sp. TaxID=165434 RepID=UPI000CA8BA4A|nr:1-aminocyclopropane-1-carboxylate deaminase/D-cysteine desulfhydrase [uncultured Arcobacter sp.]PLY09464.1 MAG: 1-aminocyclopropane-1-carboxylate deaminase [Arcobacter sp.]
MKYINSPISTINFKNRQIFIKRDDLLDIDFSGNKARKFYYFLKHDFKGIKKIISFGSAQANSLYSLSVLAKIKNVKLDFYVSHIATYLKENLQGNYKEALNNGANIIELNQNELSTQEYIENHILKSEEEYIYIEEGGRVKEAEYGIQILANEINKWAKENKKENLKVFLPSGTGTTALFLQKHLNHEVITCACVGDEEYLKKQFLQLNCDETQHPTILKNKKKYHFGKLYKEFYEIQLELLKDTNIEFDLLYDSLGWLNLISSDYFQDDDIIYIHQGGILGNESMIKRYINKYL